LSYWTNTRGMTASALRYDSALLLSTPPGAERRPATARPPARATTARRTPGAPGAVSRSPSTPSFSECGQVGRWPWPPSALNPFRCSRDRNLARRRAAAHARALAPGLLDVAYGATSSTYVTCMPETVIGGRYRLASLLAAEECRRCGSPISRPALCGDQALARERGTTRASSESRGPVVPAHPNVTRSTTTASPTAVRTSRSSTARRDARGPAWRREALPDDAAFAIAACIAAGRRTRTRARRPCTATSIRRTCCSTRRGARSSPNFRHRALVAAVTGPDRSRHRARHRCVHLTGAIVGRPRERGSDVYASGSSSTAAHGRRRPVRVDDPMPAVLQHRDDSRPPVASLRPTLRLPRVRRQPQQMAKNRATGRATLPALLAALGVPAVRALLRATAVVGRGRAQVLLAAPRHLPSRHTPDAPERNRVPIIVAGCSCSRRGGAPSRTR